MQVGDAEVDLPRIEPHLPARPGWCGRGVMPACGVAHLILWVAVRVVLHLVLEGPTEGQVNDEVDKMHVLRGESGWGRGRRFVCPT